MRMRTAMVCVVGAVLMLASAAPAAAQAARMDLAGGFQSFTDSEATHPGWEFSLAVGKEWIKAVGDVGGHYYQSGTGEQLHTFQGGVELSRRFNRVVPFGRLLSGVAVYRGDGRSDTNFVVTPEGGVKVIVNDRLGMQASVDFPFINDFYRLGGFRVFAGIVLRK